MSKKIIIATVLFVAAVQFFGGASASTDATNTVSNAFEARTAQLEAIANM